MYKIIYWYLKRPHLYPEPLRHIKRKLLKHKSDVLSIYNTSDSWCKLRAEQSDHILEKITGLKQCNDVIDLHPNLFKKAKIEVDNTPVEMGGSGDLNLLYWVCEHIKATKVIETGVAYGWSSMAILLSLQNRNNSVLISNDMPYLGKNNDHFVGCVVPESLRHNWELLKYADREGIPKAIKILGEIDLCHYDSDKSFEGRMWAYPKLWEALRPGGIFISDDIGDNMAFKKFSQSISIKPHVICKRASNSNKYIGILIKPFAEE